MKAFPAAFPCVNRLLSWPVLLLVASLLGGSASAQASRAATLVLDVREQSVQGELHLPLDQLELALKQKLRGAPASLVSRRGKELSRYVARHLAASTPDGRAFDVSVQALAVQPVNGANHLVLHLMLHPPQGASPRVFSLKYDAILHRIATHEVFVSLRHDFQSGLFSGESERLGVLHARNTQLRIDRSHGSWWRGFQAAFLLGSRHIAEGTDHLLFLLLLLLASPLLAHRGRWVSSGPAPRSVKQVIWIVTAFTLGHSLTLVTGALGCFQWPSQPVKVLIALSILISAVHGLRPLFAGREPLIAAGFGLIHGLAFSTVLTEFGFEPLALLLSVSAFNLGIEAMLLAVVVLTMPWLLLLSRSPLYPAVRRVGAGFGAVAACCWIAERAFAFQNPMAFLVRPGPPQALTLLALLALTSLAATSWRPQQAR
jgi:hypothetical protein